MQSVCDAVIFIYEPVIQGAGGMRIYSETHLTQIINCVRKKTSLCIADEVMTGFYRTGTFLASEKLTNEAQADIICLSKGITGGILPLGATLIKEEITKYFSDKNFDLRFYHGHSYTANPLACAVAVASFKLLENKNAIKTVFINQQHNQFLEKLKSQQLVKNADVIGTILRFEICTTANDGYDNAIRDKAYNFFISKGILIRPLGNVIYIMPPYIISENELYKIYKAILEFIQVLDK